MAEESGKLAVAIAAIRVGDEDIGRQLILEVLAEDPDNEAAWTWACDVAETTEERIHCLRQIVSINPSHEAARSYLARLEKEVVSPPKPEAAEVNWRFGLLQWAFPVLLVVVVVTALVYYRKDILGFFGLLPLDFDSLTISESYDRIVADGSIYQISFEGDRPSTFRGTVRHASPMRMRECPLLTHDILVTSGDYANPDIVSTSVTNHRFTWSSGTASNPSGTINLLHTLPANKEIYRRLLQVRPWDEVVITGREILSIDRLDENGKYLGEWRDAGCNTLLVQSVTVGGE